MVDSNLVGDAAGVVVVVKVVVDSTVIEDAAGDSNGVGDAAGVAVVVKAVVGSNGVDCAAVDSNVVEGEVVGADIDTDADLSATSVIADVLVVIDEFPEKVSRQYHSYITIDTESTPTSG